MPHAAFLVLLRQRYRYWISVSATGMLRKVGMGWNGLSWKVCPESNNFNWFGVGSIPIYTIFSGMNIHLPAILMFTRGTRFWPIHIDFSVENDDRHTNTDNYDNWILRYPWVPYFQRNPIRRRSTDHVGPLADPMGFARCSGETPVEGTHKIGHFGPYISKNKTTQFHKCQVNFKLI